MSGGSYADQRRRAQRRHHLRRQFAVPEIGIRIAIGLAPERATRMLLEQGTMVFVVGAVIGAAAFLVFARLLTDLVFGVPVVDGAAIAAASFVVFGVAMLATWLPARRAARVDLMTALKAES